MAATKPPTRPLWKDRLFLVSWLLKSACCIAYFPFFANMGVMFDGGKISLWSECNTTIPVWIHGENYSEPCWATERAEGPGWLDLTRTLAGFGVIANVMCLIAGFCWPQKQGDFRKLAGIARFYIEEICLLVIATLFCICLPLYFVNYHNFYSVTRTNVKLNTHFWGMVVIGCLNPVFALGLFISRDTAQCVRSKAPSSNPQPQTTTQNTVNAPVQHEPVPSGTASPAMIILAFTRMKSSLAKKEQPATRVTVVETDPSASRSGVSSPDFVVHVNTETTRDQTTLPPIKRDFSQNEATLRANAEAAVVTVRPALQTHHSSLVTGSRNTETPPPSYDDIVQSPAVYNIPGEPGTVSNTSFSYDEGAAGEGGMLPPKPVLPTDSHRQF